MEIGDHCVHAGLLAHDLGQPDAVGRRSFPPGQIPPVLRVPVQQGPLQFGHWGIRLQTSPTIRNVYGPPPHPDQVAVALGPADAPVAWLACLVLGLALSGRALWRRQPDALRAWWFCLGQTILLTAPLAMVLHQVVYGAFPTVDKSGSLLFYLEGVHRLILFHPVTALEDPAARLIGVHVGHLWFTAALDLLWEPFAAFNVQGLLQLALGWWAAALLLRELSGRWDSALVLGFAFGMNLHLFRDLNWYTIEKSAVYTLALYAWAVLRSWRDGQRWPWIAAGLYVFMAFQNWYLALVGAAGTGVLWALTRHRDITRHCLQVTVLMLPLVGYQLALLHGDQALGNPEVFLQERAVLDSFSLWPPHWNRLELWRVLEPVALGAAAWGSWTLRHDRRVQCLLGVAGALWLLSLGPRLLPEVWNPVYMGIRALVPGFWRVAKPETFFHGTWLALLAIAALRLAGRRVAWLYPLVVVVWVFGVRTHEAYPGFTKPLEQTLDPRWSERRSLEPPAP